MTPSSSSPKPTVLDLFAGAGGLSLGFSRAGFDIALAVDNNESATDTYRRNIADHVATLDLASDCVLPETTVIAGGPPCQGFSTAGLRRHGDKRNTLIAQYVGSIIRLKPVAFVFENVEGFLTAEHGSRVLELLVPLVDAGYRIHLRKLNAANYGVPQHRKRVIGIGGLGWDPPFPEPTHTAFGAPGAHLTVRHLPRTPTVREALKGLPAASETPPGVPEDHCFVPLTGIDLERAVGLKPGQKMKDLPEALWHESYRRRAFRRVQDGIPSERRGGAPAGLRRLSGDEPSKAITGAARAEFLHPSENRCLTLRECARLQTFPDDFSFSGNIGERMQLIGNAVPPTLAFVIGQCLLRGLEVASPGAKPGTLLSFVPTASSGKSPALENITLRVRAEFPETPESVMQPRLWL